MPRGSVDAGFVDELKTDKDCVVDRSWIEDYVALILWACGRFNVKVMSIAMCLSRRKGLHFYIRIQPAVPSVIANRIQWLIGDDCGRVDFNRARIEVGFKEWNKLFEEIGTKPRIIYRDRSLRRRSDA